MSKPKTYQVPFIKHNGKLSMMEWTSSQQGMIQAPGTVSGWIPTEWRHIVEFDAELQLAGTRRGRSAARVTVDNTKNKESYSMGLSGFYDAILAFGVKPGGIIRGRWTFRKQGANYALHAVVP